MPSMTPDLRELILSMPAAVPPPGVQPNFDDPANLKDEFVTIVIVLAIISTLAVGTRVYVKSRILRHMFLEDYLLIISYILYAVLFHYMAAKAAVLPLGVHQWDMTIDQFRDHTYVIVLGVWFYSPIILLLKLAINLQCLRAFCPPHSRRITFWITHGLIWAHVVFYIVVGSISVFGCTPRAKTWDPTILHGKCLNQRPGYIASAVFNAVSDFLMVVIPIHAIWKLQLPQSKKWGVSVVFLVGILAVVASLVRLHHSILLAQAKDVSFNMAVVGICSFFELGCGFLAASLPVFHKLLAALRAQPLVIRAKSSVRSLFSDSSLDTTESMTMNERFGIIKSVDHKTRIVSNETLRQRDLDLDLIVCGNIGYSIDHGIPDRANTRGHVKCPEKIYNCANFN